jgi:hypothetical protein
VSAHRSAITRYLPSSFYTTATTCSYLSTTCWKVRSWRLRTISLSLYTYSSLSTVLSEVIDANTDLYRAPYPYSLRTSNPLLTISSLDLLEPLAKPSHPSYIPHELLRTCYSPLRTVTHTPSYLLQNLSHLLQTTLTRYELSSILYTTYRRPTLYNMADINKQIDEGQNK